MTDQPDLPPACTCNADEGGHGHLFDCAVEIENRARHEAALGDLRRRIYSEGPTEPRTRNSVVLLKDGSVARRNRTDGMASYHPFDPPWTHYLASPEAVPVPGVIDPGRVVPWSTLTKVGIERVLHEAPAPTDEQRHQAIVDEVRRAEKGAG